MKNKEFYKLLKKNKSNSGFTLTELLIGLVMSTIVVGALGWGLMQLLTTTQAETSKVKTRNETSRAFNFIADEVKAAQTMDVDRSIANLNTVAPNFAPPPGGTPALSLQVPGVDQRIIYSIAPNTPTWQGPLVIHRWGPPIDATGSYTNTNNPVAWQNEALIDGVSDANQTILCDADGDGTEENVNYQGFYACIVDDDGDGVAENDATTDLNGDGVADAGDGADTDGLSITAQLYFAGDTEDGVYLTDSQVVARARVAPLRKPELNENKLLEIAPLPGNYGREISPGTSCWTVRNDFGQGTDPTALPNSGNELQDVTTVIHEDGRQPQPVNIDTSKPLTIVASAFGGINAQCLARGNKYQRIWDSASNGYRYVDGQGNTILPKQNNETDEQFQNRLASNGVPADGSEEIHTYEYKIWHTIDFSDHNTFNGSNSNLSDPSDVSRDAASNSPAEGTEGAGDVRIFKNGDRIDSSADYLGYDADNTGDRDQDSLETFLQDKGFVDGSGNVVNLEPNQRIIAFEIGQDLAQSNGNVNPGFDLQDNVFVMTSDAFK